mmetsp:Transcript_9438/g.28048  ORF Transcript_9438/g.28048 Transcript_9438/m.28048 type:complete len:200 (-) Transcript_9438:641-1240(-)
MWPSLTWPRPWPTAVPPRAGVVRPCCASRASYILVPASAHARQPLGVAVELAAKVPLRSCLGQTSSPGPRTRASRWEFPSRSSWKGAPSPPSATATRPPACWRPSPHLSPMIRALSTWQCTCARGLARSPCLTASSCRRLRPSRGSCPRLRTRARSAGCSSTSTPSTSTRTAGAVLRLKGGRGPGLPHCTPRRPRTLQP